jgi:hypothetical protein
VINNVGVFGAEQEVQDGPFLQPRIGEIIYFLDGVSGVVKKVIINPNNRRVIAMIIEGKFTDRHAKINLLTEGNTGPPEPLVVVPMNEVRYLTKVSGFLHINSNEQKRYMNFDSASFHTPHVDWTPPHPYCPDDVLFPVEQREVEYQILEQLPRPPFVVALQEQVLWEQLLANDSLGG